MKLIYIPEKTSKRLDGCSRTCGEHGRFGPSPLTAEVVRLVTTTAIVIVTTIATGMVTIATGIKAPLGTECDTTRLEEIFLARCKHHIYISSYEPLIKTMLTRIHYQMPGTQCSAIPGNGDA